MDKIIRCITSDGAVMATAVDASDIVFTAKKLHNLSRSATAALGRLLCAASVMGNMLKQDGAFLNLRVLGDGELGAVVAVGDSRGNVRGYVENPDCPTEYYPNGKINVAKAVGANGTLSVLRDYGSGDPYIGQVELTSGEIAEDIAGYYATSEQIPTVCALGVLINKEDGEVLLAGGMLELIRQQGGIDKGMSILDICKTALDGFEVEVLDEYPVNYVCGCSREKLERYFMTMSDEELRTLPDETGKTEAVCQFCNKRYVFTAEDLERLIREKS